MTNTTVSPGQPEGGDHDQAPRHAAIRREDRPWRTLADLEAGLDRIRRSPRDAGWLELVVRRPAIGAREMLDEGALDEVHGLVGDNWSDRSRDPHRQITVMNARVIELLAGGKNRWALAGDQLFVDFDLSESNLPPGTRLQIGSAVVEVSAPPHRGCRKFAARFGADATAFVNSSAGIELNLRGINARIVQGGAIRVGDAVRKVVWSR
jgi:MOSC domain-containing protein YiiM